MRILLLVLLSTAVASAQVPQGHYHLTFTNPPVWDLTGTYDSSAGATTLIVNLAVMSNGKIIGTRTENFTNGEDFIIGPALVGGRMMSKPAQVGYVDQWKGDYFGVVGGTPLRAQASTRGKGVVVPSTLSLQSTGKLKFCMVGEKCTTSDVTTDVQIPQPMDGTWAIDMDISGAGNKLSGQATVVLSSSRSFSYTVSGVYNPTTTKGVLRMKGTGDASRTRITL